MIALHQTAASAAAATREMDSNKLYFYSNCNNNKRINISLQPTSAVSPSERDEREMMQNCAQGENKLARNVSIRPGRMDVVEAVTF